MGKTIGLIKSNNDKADLVVNPRLMRSKKHLLPMDAALIFAAQ
jgi:hypothetical protein